MPSRKYEIAFLVNAYEEARREASQIYDRAALAAYWLAKLQWFTDRLAPEADPTLVDIIEACQEHYELYA